MQCMSWPCRRTGWAGPARTLDASRKPYGFGFGPRPVYDVQVSSSLRQRTDCFIPSLLWYIMSGTEKSQFPSCGATDLLSKPHSQQPVPKLTNWNHKTRHNTQIKIRPSAENQLVSWTGYPFSSNFLFAACTTFPHVLWRGSLTRLEFRCRSCIAQFQCMDDSGTSAALMKASMLACISS